MWVFCWLVLVGFRVGLCMRFVLGFVCVGFALHEFCVCVCCRRIACACALFVMLPFVVAFRCKYVWWVLDWLFRVWT